MLLDTGIAPNATLAINSFHWQDFPPILVNFNFLT